jgi:outer membrane protein assembly factor BamB
MKYVARSFAVFLAAFLGPLLISSAQVVHAQEPPADKAEKPAPHEALDKLRQMQKSAAPAPAAPTANFGLLVGEPMPVTTRDGKFKGWKVVIPGNRPLATPAVVDGKVFVGGGFGSHEFYAFDAVSGKKVWQYSTADDGPTAAVVQDGYVAFNTESCELEVLTLEGKPVWKKWLGDPLMSMPAIAEGKVYMAYPNSKGDREHYLACFDLKTGKEEWKHKIAGEIITAPVIEQQMVYLATLDGTLYCFKQSDGTVFWIEKKNATSSPVVANGFCYYSRRSEVTLKRDGKEYKQQTEELAGRGTAPAGASQALKETMREADYLDYGKRSATASEKQLQSADAAVGFGGMAKGDSKINQAKDNLGQASVSGIWAYQGSKPFIYKDQLFSCMGDTVQCVDLKTDKVLWKKSMQPTTKKDKAEPLLDSVLTPPALVNDKVFLGTTFGEVRCLSAKTGELLWAAPIGEPIVFQPAVAKGRVYVSTNTGHLYCLETGDPKDDGWLMWGANAAHNGLPK